MASSLDGTTGNRGASVDSGFGSGGSVVGYNGSGVTNPLLPRFSVRDPTMPFKSRFLPNHKFTANNSDSKENGIPHLSIDSPLPEGRTIGGNEPQRRYSQHHWLSNGSNGAGRSSLDRDITAGSYNSRYLSRPRIGFSVEPDVGRLTNDDNNSGSARTFLPLRHQRSRSVVPMADNDEDEEDLSWLKNSRPPLARDNWKRRSLNPSTLSRSSYGENGNSSGARQRIGLSVEPDAKPSRFLPIRKWKNADVDVYNNGWNKSSLDRYEPSTTLDQPRTRYGLSTEPDSSRFLPSFKYGSKYEDNDDSEATPSRFLPLRSQRSRSVVPEMETSRFLRPIRDGFQRRSLNAKVTTDFDNDDSVSYNPAKRNNYDSYSSMSLMEKPRRYGLSAEPEQSRFLPSTKFRRKYDDDDDDGDDDRSEATQSRFLPLRHQRSRSVVPEMETSRFLRPPSRDGFQRRSLNLNRAPIKRLEANDDNDDSVSYNVSTARRNFPLRHQRSRSEVPSIAVTTENNWLRNRYFKAVTDDDEDTLRRASSRISGSIREFMDRTDPHNKEWNAIQRKRAVSVAKDNFNHQDLSNNPYARRAQSMARNNDDTADFSVSYMGNGLMGSRPPPPPYNNNNTNNQRRKFMSLEDECNWILNGGKNNNLGKIYPPNLHRRNVAAADDDDEDTLDDISGDEVDWNRSD